LVLFSLVILLYPSCQSRKAILKEKWEKNPTLRITYWTGEWKKAPFHRRIKQAPPELIEKIRIENEIEGFDEKPVPVKPPQELFMAMSTIKESMPENLKTMLEERLIGVFAVKELGGTGYADVVYDRDGQETYGLIVLDADLLMKRKANEWATWKENSIFKPKSSGGIKLKAIIEEEKNNTVENAVRFILLHEIGHILGIVSKSHSSWIDWIVNKKINMDYPFQRLSWKITHDKKIISFFEDNFPERKNIKVYSFEKAKLTNQQILSAYNHLVSHTNFPSLYAGQSLWEDFAESFTIYFHVVIDKRPWQIVIEQEEQPQVLIRSCWGDERCDKKEAYMRKWFENPLSVSAR